MLWARGGLGFERSKGGGQVRYLKRLEMPVSIVLIDPIAPTITAACNFVFCRTRKVSRGELANLTAPLFIHITYGMVIPRAFVQS